MNEWTITESEVFDRIKMLGMTNAKGTPIDDILIAGDSESDEFEFVGFAHKFGIASCTNSNTFMVFPTKDEYKANKNFKNIVCFETGDSYRASHIDYHDLCMCFGIMFTIDGSTMKLKRIA